MSLHVYRDPPESPAEWAGCAFLVSYAGGSPHEAASRAAYRLPADALNRGVYLTVIQEPGPAVGRTAPELWRFHVGTPSQIVVRGAP